MAFTYVGGNENGADVGTTPSVTHSLTINSGDLVALFCVSNDNTSISVNSDAGASWTTELNQVPPTTPATETANYLFAWKVANGTEPTAYACTIGSSTNWYIMVKVFRPASGTPIIDAALNAPNGHGTKTFTHVLNAADGQTISDDAVSIIGGFKDNRGGTGSYTTADNSYTGVLGDSNNQDCAMCHRIYTTGTTFSGDVIVTNQVNSTSDYTYSFHISFLEGASSSVAPMAMAYYSKRRG